MNKSVSYPLNFRGLLWEPTYHDEVIMLFGILLPYFDESYAIDKCQRPFPDCFAFLSSKKSNKPWLMTAHGNQGLMIRQYNCPILLAVN